MKKLGSDLMKLVCVAAVVFGTAQLGAVGSGARFADAVLFSAACYAVALVAYVLNGELERAIEHERRLALRRAAARRLARMAPPSGPVPAGRAA